ncbi:MAG: hypothetical protein F4Y47_08380 [Acidobacteriia bacterium]|nr:hypothetical protein [Terriglobia bacterium]MYG03947.1 hypothetical protein [Terriglobia bacterium]MYK10375.1 hypothetical protein [Terriglobia bacterium]
MASLGFWVERLGHQRKAWRCGSRFRQISWMSAEEYAAAFRWLDGTAANAAGVGELNEMQLKENTE